MAHYLTLEGLSTFLTNIKNNVKGWLGINASSGSSTKFLNEQGNFVTVSGTSPYDSTPADVSTSAGSAGDSAYYARGNHVHKLPSSVALTSGTYPDMTAGSANKVRYQDGNEINFANVPTTGNKHRSWFNYSDGDTNQANPSNPIKSYWFGDRNGKTDNTKLVTGGITNKTFIGSSSSVTWNSSVGTGYGCCCIKFSYDLTTGKTRTVVIRLLIDSNKSDGDMCYVDLMLKVHPNDWNSYAISTGRFDVNFNLGRIYYRKANDGYYFAVETGAISSKVTPIVIGSDDESDADYDTLNVEFGDFNSELVSSDWIQHRTKRSAYMNIGAPIGNSTTPVYVDISGQINPCGFSVNFGTPVSGANVLNIVTA